jgi:hypothetical protein
VRLPQFLICQTENTRILCYNYVLSRLSAIIDVFIVRNSIEMILINHELFGRIGRIKFTDSSHAAVKSGAHSVRRQYGV